jgi:uncharacterized protein YjiS (DUF1127 family)
MSLLQDVTTAKQGSSDASSMVSMVRAHRNARRAKRSQLPSIWRIVGLWLRRRNDRAILRSLSLHDIHDFCPRHTEAEEEMNKPFWQA